MVLTSNFAAIPKELIRPAFQLYFPSLRPPHLTLQPLTLNAFASQVLPAKNVTKIKSLITQAKNSESANAKMAVSALAIPTTNANVSLVLPDLYVRKTSIAKLIPVKTTANVSNKILINIPKLAMFASVLQGLSASIAKLIFAARILA